MTDGKVLLHLQPLHIAADAQRLARDIGAGARQQALRIMGTARGAQRKGPVRSISMQRRQSAGSISSTPPVGPAMPALLMSASRPPSSFAAVLKSLSTSFSEETSAATASEPGWALR